METKTIWQKILPIAITILTAIATTLGTTSCMDMRTKQKRICLVNTSALYVELPVYLTTRVNSGLLPSSLLTVT